jgi:hypothetical protein
MSDLGIGVLRPSGGCDVHQRTEADMSVPILIATWKFLDSEAFGQDGRINPYDSKGPKSLPLALDLKLLK